MKIKTAAQTAEIGKGHKYLGHFKKAKHLNRGHNDVKDGEYERDPKIVDDGSRVSDSNPPRFLDKLPPYSERTNTPKPEYDSRDEKMVKSGPNRPYMGIKFHKM